jgi:maleate isomerase
MFLSYSTTTKVIRMPRTQKLFGPRLRVGVVVPPANDTVEAELPSLLPSGIQCYVSRLPVGSGSLLERVHNYNVSFAETVSAFGGLELDVVYLACTGSSYLLGASSEHELADAVHRLHPRLGVLTAAQAIRQELERLKVRQVVLISPYPEELTALAVKFWTDWGFDVRSVQNIVTNRIYDTSSSDVREAVKLTEHADGDVVLISGTGLPTVEVCRELQTTFVVPVLSSITCAGIQLSTYDTIA